jgi:hypothetical protein
VNEVIRSGGNSTDVAHGISGLEEMEALRNKVADEALHSALRIAGLVSRLSFRMIYFGALMAEAKLAMADWRAYFERVSSARSERHTL